MSFRLPNWLTGLWGPPLDPKLGRLETVPFDGVPWKIVAPPHRIIAVGDLHGDLSALASILRAARLVDENGSWVGDRAALVLLGDLLGGHEDSRLLLEFVIRLQIEARARGGDIHTLLGNHDLLAVQQKYRGFTRREKKEVPKVPHRRQTRGQGQRGLRGKYDLRAMAQRM